MKCPVCHESKYIVIMRRFGGEVLYRCNDDGARWRDELDPPERSDDFLVLFR